MYRVKDGQVIELPKNGFLSDGRAVSNYRYLPKKVLEKEGWISDKKDRVDEKEALRGD